MNGVVDRPAGLPDSAGDLWERGVPDTSVHPGDLWVLSWDGQAVGHAVISAVKTGFVLVWPVTLPGEPAFAPGLTISQSPLGVPLTAWPTRETGIGLFLLDRSLGQLLDRDRLIAISDAFDEGRDPGYPFARGSAADDQNRSADATMIEHWRDLCFNLGAVPEGQFLDSEKVKAHGGSSKNAAQTLHLSVEALRDIWLGLEPASDEQVAALAASLGVRPSDITAPDPWEETLEALSSPAYKQDLKARLSALGTTEERLRLVVRTEFALAARDDKDSLTEQKMRDAIWRAGE